MKTVIITGASRGIGGATAKLFAENGWHTVLNCDKDIVSAEKLAAELAAKGCSAEVYAADVGVMAECEKMVGYVLSRRRRVDALVNNAGVSLIKPFTDLTDGEAERIMKVNFGGIYNMCKAVVPHMISRKYGRIINVTSVWGSRGSSCETMYCASKAAVISLTQSAARMAAKYGVRVNSIAPGIIRTSMWEEILDGMAHGWNPANKSPLNAQEREELWQSSVQKMIPMGHAQQPEDIAWATVFLASNLAREITGQVLTIDGGTTMV